MIKKDIYDKEYSGKDIYDKEYSGIHINKCKLIKQAHRYRMDVRFALGLIKTQDEFEKDKKRILKKLII